MNTVGAPCAGKPHARSDEGALGTLTTLAHDDGLSPCVGNARRRQPGLQASSAKPVLYSTLRSALRMSPTVHVIGAKALTAC